MLSAVALRDRCRNLGRAADAPHAAGARRVSATRLRLPQAELFTSIQSDSSRSDSPVRVLYAQPGSPVSVGHVRRGEICPTFRLALENFFGHGLFELPVVAARGQRQRSTSTGRSIGAMPGPLREEIDANFAAPHAGLALATISDYVSDWALDPAQALDEAERWARRAVELNDHEPLSHMALGAVLLWRRDHEGALAESRRMMALDPNFAQGYAATGLALMYAGRAAERSAARRLCGRSQRAQPAMPADLRRFS
jgi:hypothetical protein